MFEIIASKNYRDFINNQEITLSDWDKATLICNHRTATYYEKGLALLDLKMNSTDELLKKQIQERLSRDSDFHFKFQDNCRNAYYILKLMENGKYIVEGYYSNFVAAHAEGVKGKMQFCITKNLFEDEELDGNRSGVFGTVEYDEDGNKKNILCLYCIDDEEPFDEHSKDRFENKYIELPLMFRRKDIVHIIGTEKYGIVDWPENDDEEIFSKEKLGRLDCIDYSDFQVPVNLIYDGDKFLSVFSHDHVAPTDLEYAELEDMDPRKGMLEYMVKTLYESSWFGGSGRDPGRINAVLTELELVWRQYPDMRLGQLLTNVCGRVPLFSIEDEMILERLQHNKFPVDD